MKENVCVTCEYYEKCNKPEREIKCMGYKEKEKENEQSRKVRVFNQLHIYAVGNIKLFRYISSQHD